MSRRNKRLLAIGLSVVTVVASGQYMERSQAAATSQAPAVTHATLVGPVVTVMAARGDAAADPTPARLSRAMPVDPPAPALPGLAAPRSATPDDRVTDLTADNGRYGVSGLPCGPTLDIRPAGEGGMRAILSAPCRPGARVTLIHDILRVTERTDSMGLMSLELPALTPDAAIVAAFDDGTTATGTLPVPGAARAPRALLMSNAASGLHLHAFEGGASFGNPGHIWAEAPRHNRARGRFFVLGDATRPDAQLAEVYAAPARTPAPHLSVEAEVTEANCGREVTARLVVPGPSGRPVAQTLSFALPGCAALGEFLLLKNLPQARTLAAN